MWQNGGWTWAASSRALWSRYRALFLSPPAPPGNVWLCAGAVWPRWSWQTMIVTVMVMNEESRARGGGGGGVKNAFQELLPAAAHEYTLIGLINVAHVWSSSFRVNREGFLTETPRCVQVWFIISPTRQRRLFPRPPPLRRKALTLARISLFGSRAKLQAIKINLALHSSVNMSVLVLVTDVILSSRPQPLGQNSGRKAKRKKEIQSDGNMTCGLKQSLNLPPTKVEREEPQRQGRLLK